MKIKPVINDKSIYNLVRYNENILTHHNGIKHGLCNSEKKDYSVMVLLSLIYLSDYFDTDDDTDTIKKAIYKAYKNVNNTFLKDGGVNNS